MENNIDIPDPNNTSDISNYLFLSEFRKTLFNEIINSLDLPNGSRGLDAGCGIGFYTRILSEAIREDGTVIGVDLSKDLIKYANKNKIPNVDFEVGNINSLRYEENFFDWIWSADTVWPGPKELGCPNEDPTVIINEFHRVLRPGGIIAILFWSTQKFLPGYPLLEARLNMTSGATAPFIRGMNPKYHIMNAKYWLEKSGFKHISAKTFLADINAPLDENSRNALNIFFQMLWGQSESQLSENDWKEYKQLCDPNSSKHIFNNPQYYGFYTYTLFRGIK